MSFLLPVQLVTAFLKRGSVPVIKLLVRYENLWVT